VVPRAFRRERQAVPRVPVVISAPPEARRAGRPPLVVRSGLRGAPQVALGVLVAHGVVTEVPAVWLEEMADRLDEPARDAHRERVA